MAYRIDADGYQSLVDAVASGSASSGVMVTDDGVRDPVAHDPWESKEEYALTESLRMALVPRDQIAAIRPIVPMSLFPPEDEAYDRTPLTIEGAIDSNRWLPSMRLRTSGSSKAIRRQDGQEDVWSGTSRNVSMSVNPMG